MSPSGAPCSPVADRLERIEALLGRPLEGPIVLRLAAALLGQRILADQVAAGDPSVG